MSVDCGTPSGQLFIDDVSMHCPAWNILDLLDLWVGGDIRGSDLLMPLATGARPYRRRYTVSRRSLPIAICGEVDPEGTPYGGDVWEGLEANIDLLMTQVVEPVASDTGTREARLIMPSGAERTADIHVLGLAIGRHGQGVNQITGSEGVIVLATLEISIPNGRLT